jgi:predicted NACHT family NTPase
MVEWLTVWGVYTVAGFVFAEVLAPLAKGALEDYTKDFFKGCIKDFTGLFEQDTLKKIVGKALKEFLQLVQQELEDADFSEEELKAYTKPLKEFINDKSVKEILGSAFQEDCQAVDTKRLAKIWYQINLPSLPDEFDWERVGKRYVKKVKAIIRESDELRAILDSQNLEAIQKNIKELAGIPTEFDLRRYQEGLRERYGNLNLDSLDTTVYDYREKLKVWQIFTAQNVRECQDFLPQVYEIPKEHQKRLRESNELEADVDPEEWERYKQVYYQQPVRSVLDIVNDIQSDRLPPQPPLVRGEKDLSVIPPLAKGGLGGVNSCRYIVILGDPGSGKSTLLQYIALNWARTPLNSVISQPIPLLIELRTYIRDRDSGQCKDFLEFFHKGSVICRLNQHELDERLKAGKVLVMFDGLDEVFDPAKREEVITDIHRFTNDYPNVRVIVTSRIIGYKPQRLRDAQFRHFMLQDLESDQIQDFIHRWHELTFTDETDKVRKRERLQQAIKTSSAIGELAGNPLLLTMMAILNRNQELPRDRPELYNQASRVLLYQWDVEQKLLENPRVDSVAIDYKDKQAMLRQVAYHMQAADKGLAGNLIRGDDLERILTSYLKSIEVSQARTVARLLIEQLRSRNFILCYLGADSYAFVHRTFLEYFCACEFVERFGKRGTEGGLMLEELKTEVFGKHWQDESWHEVLRLIAGMIDTSFAGEIIDYLMALNGEAQRFINLFLAAKCLSEVRNRSAIASTATRLLKRLKSLTKYDPYSSHFYRKDDEIFFRTIETKAVTAIATTWKEDPDTLPWLKTLAVSDGDEFVRMGAVIELARSWKEDPDTLPILERVVLDGDEYVLPVAVHEVARGWKDDPNTLPWLKMLAVSDNHPVARAEAVQELARGWKDDPDTLPLLKTLARSKDDWVVRQAAVQELVKGWKNDPNTLAILKSCAFYTVSNDVLNQEDWLEREAAMRELARGWKNEPWLFEFWRDIALNDPFKCNEYLPINPRQTALEAIIEQYPNHPQTLPLLQDRAENDPDEQVREFAKTKLEQLERQN